MKIFYLITAVFLLSLIGCSSTYTIKDFSTKEKFYSDFNKFADSKNLKITLTNDSSFTAEGKTEISEDSLIITMNVPKEDIYKSLPISEIRRISYKNYWLGIPFGFLGGAIIGLGIGGGIASYDAHHSSEFDKGFEPPLNALTGIVLGSLGGSVVGWILGWDYTYQFNP